MDKIHSLTGMLDHYDDGDRDNISVKIFETEKRIKKIFSSYKYSEIRTPALEDTNLFIRSAGDSSDIVNKEIYSFDDRNNKNIALRPEGTASAIRAIIEKKLDQSTHKIWYMGPMWRYERPQKGRFRQFHQVGVEYLGVEEGISEYELISMVLQINQFLEISEYTIKINHLGDSEAKVNFCNALVSFLSPHIQDLHPKDQSRLNSNT